MTQQEWAVLETHPARSGRVLVLGSSADGFVTLKARPCPFLSGNGCAVYESRPTACRRFMCGRDNVATEPFEDAAVPMKVLTSRDLRRQYAVNQRKTMQKWGHAHGWSA